MSLSDIINTILCILSFVLAVISVVTVIITLKQNSKMIKNSTRPYVVSLLQFTNFQSSMTYLVLKNYGNSGAIITKMESSIPLQKISFSQNYVPFEKIAGAFLAPGQAMTCTVDADKLREIKTFNICLSYTDGVDEYHETYPINYQAHSTNTTPRANSHGEEWKELRNISYALQDLVEKQF